MAKIKKPISVLLSLIMVVGVFTAVPFAASAAGAVSYLDENGNQQTVAAGAYTPVASSVTEWTEGTYVVSANVSITERVTVSGDVLLILCDNFTLNANDGVNVAANNSLTICAQSTGGSKGVLNATAGRTYYSGLGGGNRESCGTVTINGGKVTAAGNDYGAGIGGGYNGTGGTITINGGTVETNGGNYAAGIGGGISATGGDITINGGAVEANGGSYGAAIGGGSRGAGGNIAINGGTVEANKANYGTGVGGGNNGDGGAITLCCTNASDSITASSYNGAVSVTGERTVTDGNNLYSGELSGSQITAIAGKTLAAAFMIAIDETIHGTVTADKRFVAANAQDKTVTLDVTPDEGYKIYNIGYTANDRFTFIHAQNGVYSFTMPEADVRIEATFSIIPVSVAYLDENGESKTVDAIPLDGTKTDMDSGWYFVGDDLEYTARIGTGVDSRLILGDGCTLNAKNGINVNKNCSLTIYAQSTGNSMGVLNASTANVNAGIGGGQDDTGGAVTINGGKVTAASGSGAGIGGGEDGTGGAVTINGGAVTATSDGGAGIGGGYDGECGDITINGGKVTAEGNNYGAGIGVGINGTGGTITINGGKVAATSKYDSGIGGEDSEVTLSYTKGTDSIYASSYSGTITLEKPFFNGTVILPAGEVSAEDIAGKTLVPYDGIGARLVGNTLSLDGDIGVNFYMVLAPEIAQSQTAYMLFTIPNGDKTETKTVYVKDITPIGGYYIFKCNVSAKEMTSEIKAQIIDGNNIGTEYTYSVKEYADYLLENKDEYGTDLQREYAKAAPLVRAMLNYGAYAKEFFDKTNTLDDLDDAEIAAPETMFDLPEDVTFEGATLSLKSETTLSLYFTEKNNATLTFTCDDKTVETAKSGNYQIARIRGIAAAELQDSFTLKINGIDAVTYSPMNYCCNALDGGTTNRRLQNTVKALYAYSEAAIDYFGKEGE